MAIAFARFAVRGRINVQLFFSFGQLDIGPGGVKGMGIAVSGWGSKLLIGGLAIRYVVCFVDFDV